MNFYNNSGGQGGDAYLSSCENLTISNGSFINSSSHNGHGGSFYMLDVLKISINSSLFRKV